MALMRRKNSVHTFRAGCKLIGNNIVRNRAKERRLGVRKNRRLVTTLLYCGQGSCREANDLEHRKTRKSRAVRREGLLEALGSAGRHLGNV
jgi:hypothetical protein